MYIICAAICCALYFWGWSAMYRLELKSIDNCFTICCCVLSRLLLLLTEQGWVSTWDRLDIWRSLFHSEKGMDADGQERCNRCLTLFIRACTWIIKLLGQIVHTLSFLTSNMIFLPLQCFLLKNNAASFKKPVMLQKRTLLSCLRLQNKYYCIKKWRLMV